MFFSHSSSPDSFHSPTHQLDICSENTHTYRHIQLDTLILHTPKERPNDCTSHTCRNNRYFCSLYHLGSSSSSSLASPASVISTTVVGTFSCHSKCLHFIYIFGLHLIEPTTLRFDSLNFHFTVSFAAVSRCCTIQHCLIADSFTLILSTLLFICHRVVKICKVVCSRQRQASGGGGESANLCTHKDFPILKLIYIVDGMKIFVITKQNLSLRNSLKFV